LYLLRQPRRVRFEPWRPRPGAIIKGWVQPQKTTTEDVKALAAQYRLHSHGKGGRADGAEATVAADTFMLKEVPDEDFRP
jgi:hypothetical protein